MGTPPTGRSPAMPAEQSSKTRLSVSNLSRTVNADHLIEIFGLFGKVRDATIAMDEALGLSKGYGYVEMASENDAREAIDHLHNGQIDGNVIKVEVYADRQRRLAAEKAAADKAARKPEVRDSKHATKDRDRDRDKDRDRDRRDKSDRDREKEKEKQKEKERQREKEKERKKHKESEKRKEKEKERAR